MLRGCYGRLLLLSDCYPNNRVLYYYLVRYSSNGVKSDIGKNIIAVSTTANRQKE